MGIEQFDEDYFMRGEATGKSLYSNYHWIAELTVPMIERMIAHCGITQDDRVLDFGCARGYSVKAFRQLGYKAYGVDVSEWAIENCDPEVKEHLALGVLTSLHRYDWIIAKDVLEHICYVDHQITALMGIATKGIFAVVPLSEYEGTDYIIGDYEKDITHVQRHPLLKWAKMFLRPGWSVEMAYRVPGVKDNYFKPGWEKGNGFLTARKVVE